MPIQTADYHRQNYLRAIAFGRKLNAGESVFVPVGFTGIELLVKSYPTPYLSAGEAFETYFPGGRTWDQSQPDTSFQGAITFYDTESGVTRQFLTDIVAQGGFFDAWAYEGTADRYTAAYLLERCIVKVDPVERDFESRTQSLLVSGQISYNFFGTRKPGNIV